jgi:hypothetical protein
MGKGERECELTRKIKIWSQMREISGESDWVDLKK